MRTEDVLFVGTDYRILFEDEFFLVVDKPAPLPVHPVGRFKEKNLLSFLKRDLRPGPEGFQIVNRLDSETSGLVLVSKSGWVAGQLGLLFERREVFKEYQGIVFGRPVPLRGTISIPLGTEAHKNIHNVRKPDLCGETAQTDYEVLDCREDYSLVRVMPRTGRTHQIRAHLAFLGCPIVGDKIYIDPCIFERYLQNGWEEDMLAVVKAKRLLLHATRLAFRHPVTGEHRSFSAAMPVCFDSFLESAGRKS